MLIIRVIRDTILSTKREVNQMPMTQGELQKGTKRQILKQAGLK